MIVTEQPNPRPASDKGFSQAVWAIIAACGTYFCMYMFRKPFTAAKFEDLKLFGLGFKSVLVITQVLGYTISKFIGIKLVAEADRSKRIGILVVLILVSELALIGFGLTPTPWNFLWLFLNGLPLGMVFGLVLAFLEGRRQTELLAAGLCASFVFADGIAKAVGTWLTGSGVPEVWMPALAGLLFIVPLGFFSWMLSRIPDPSEVDVEARAVRPPMSGEDRKSFFRKFALGLVPLLLMYGLVGILRGVRGDFAPEIWKGMNTKVDPGIFASSEFYAGAGALIVFALVTLVRNNRTGFLTGLGLAITGCGIVIAAILGYQSGVITPYAFMVINGFGLYLPYFAVHTTVFERLIAFTKQRGNIGYLMYLADAGSYAAYVVVLFARNLSKPDASSFLPFFVGLSWFVAVVGILSLIPTGVIFSRFRTSE